MRRVKVGIIGCGIISNQYLGNAPKFPIIELAACADIDIAKAKAQAEKYNVPKACSPAELLADPSIEIVINLTIPAAHFPVSMDAIAAGKHVFNEKPLAVTRDEAKQMLDAAAKKNVRVGCAPDTFLGAGQQTARKAIDDGLIGQPLVGMAFMLCPGHESWHTNPEFYYQPGGGPMLDMGPYYLTALTNLLGPIKRIAGIAGILKTDRTVAGGPLKGKKIKVETPDHVAGTIEFANGVIVTMVTSFATYFGTVPSPIIIHGTQGVLWIPDPNGFDGKVQVRRLGDESLVELPAVHHLGYGRMAGVADMAHAIQANRPHRASGQLAYAVLDAMVGFLDSSASGKAYEPQAKAERPSAMPVGGTAGVIDQ